MPCERAGRVLTVGIATILYATYKDGLTIAVEQNPVVPGAQTIAGPGANQRLYVANQAGPQPVDLASYLIRMPDRQPLQIVQSLA